MNLGWLTGTCISGAPSVSTKYTYIKLKIPSGIFSMQENTGEFLNTRLSCVDPGNPINTSINCLFSSQIPCKTIVMLPLRFI